MTDPARVEVVARALADLGEPHGEDKIFIPWRYYTAEAEAVIRALDAHDAKTGGRDG